MHNGPQRGKPAKATHFWPTTKRLISYLGPWKWGVIVSVIMAIISVVLSIMAPKILGEATTTIYDGGGSWLPRNESGDEAPFTPH